MTSGDGATLQAQIACVKRELAMREANYPKWIATGRMSADTAKNELRAMRAVLDTIHRLHNQHSLFQESM